MKGDIFMKTGSLFTTAIILIVFSAVFCAAAFAQQTESTAAVIATVNGQSITRTDLAYEINRIKYRAALRGQQIEPDQMPAVEKSLADMLVNRELLYQASLQKGIVITDESVDKRIARIKASYPDASEYDEMLAGLQVSEAVFREKLKRGIAIETLLDVEVRSGISVSDEEVDYIYKNNPNAFKTPEQVRARHILIKAAPDADAAEKTAAREKINALKEKLAQGADFAALARQYSEGPSGVKGGDLGYFDRSRMVKPFADAAFALDVGGVSDIVETQFGLHLITVVDRKPAGTIDFADAKPRIVQKLKDQRTHAAVKAYIENLEKAADIQRTSF